MEAERIPRGADATLHLKLGPGGLSDVEWTVQLLQMHHAHAVPELRTTATLPALRAARQEGLLRDDEADILGAAWVMASRIRNAVMIVRGKSADTVPSDVRTLAGVARLVGSAGDNPATSWRTTAG